MNGKGKTRPVAELEESLRKANERLSRKRLEFNDAAYYLKRAEQNQARLERRLAEARERYAAALAAAALPSSQPMSDVDRQMIDMSMKAVKRLTAQEES